eukprot:9240798-Alexandrium_andersonii.AAC.1
MSASLVGSEMCIRDRAPGTSQGLPYARTSRGSLLPRGPVPWAHSQPVSYTHLTLPTICSV